MPETARVLRLVAGLAICGLAALTGAQDGRPAIADGGVHWDYHSHGGPGGWGELMEPGSGVPAFPECNLHSQSPVGVPRRAPRGAGLKLDYGPTPFAVLHNGHTIQVPYEPGSTMTVDGKSYTLLQFHFHSPSEHVVHGRPAALEAHFVHKAEDGEFAVLGVLMEEGRANAGFQRILNVMPDGEAIVSTSGVIDAAGFLPDDLNHYAYEGSLTTPPCTEGVRWFLLEQQITVSAEQIERFRELEFLNPEGAFTGNARPVQPLNNRLGAADTASGSVTVSPPKTGSGGLVIR